MANITTDPTESLNSSPAKQQNEDGSSQTTNGNGAAVFQHNPASKTLEREFEAGCLPDKVYEAALSPWRLALRRGLIALLNAENEVMAAVQQKVRNPFLDKYFFWTSLFGTHSFFMFGLPMFFWFGNDADARGLLFVIGLGVWVSSFAKDLACAPRPFSPPIIRLSMSTHGLEYGFPSSHSTNTVSSALLLGAWLTRKYDMGDLSDLQLYLGRAALVTYGLSVILGRLYCGMHSTTDCVAGSIMGYACWLFWTKVGPTIELWLEQTGIVAPLLCIAICLLLVHEHPEPVDDCPCFEDAIAFLSVMQGVVLGYWYNHHIMLWDPSTKTQDLTPFGTTGIVATSATALLTLVKIALGVAAIFVWRLAMKRILAFLLPGIFRTVSTALHFALPTRKHYTPATEYESVPKSHLRAIPSMQDMPSEAQLVSALPRRLSVSLRRRISSESVEVASSPYIVSRPEDDVAHSHIVRYRKKTAQRIHYDVDVLTKVVVYTGIPIIVIYPVRMLFRVIEQLVMS